MLYSISGTRPLALVVEWGNMPLWAFYCWAPENDSNRGFAYLAGKLGNMHKIPIKIYRSTHWPLGDFDKILDNSRQFLSQFW